MYSENIGPYSNFLLYDVHNVVITEEDNFDGAKIMVLGRTCHEIQYEDEEEHCYPSIPSIYVYDAFDPEDTEQGLLASIKGKSTYIGEDDGCPSSFSNCTRILTDFELFPGDYTVVTAFDNSPSTLMNMIMVRNQNDDGFDVHDSWSATYSNSWFSYEDDERVYYSGDDRLYFPVATPEDHYDHDDHTHERPCPSEMSDEECDSMYEFHDLHNYIMENITAYENNEISALDMAMLLTNFIVTMDERGMFSNDHDDHGDHHGYEGEGTWIRDSRGTGRNVACTENIVPTDVTACTQWRNNYGHEEIVDFKVLANYEGKQEESSVWVVSDQGDDEEGEYLVEGDWYFKEGSGAIMWREDITPNDDWWNEGDDEDHDDHDHDDHDHGDHDDGDDNPATLDGIIGVQDPEDGDCVISGTNMVGNVAVNAGLPMMCSFEFKIKFEGVDSSKMQHEAHLPFQDEESWSLEFVMLEGYEFKSCDNCEVDANGIMTGTGPVKVTFGKVEEKEPQADCDYVVGLDSTGMAFDPIELKIKAGETVCWQWKDAAMKHNVLELEAEYDSSMNLTNINFGFSSGDPEVTVDFRHTFTKDNMTHYYVCEPHAASGMVGRIIVGEGADVDPVQEALDDNEVPSIGFVIGSLVLVGAAGLRRRIH